MPDSVVEEAAPVVDEGDEVAVKGERPAVQAVRPSWCFFFFLSRGARSGVGGRSKYFCNKERKSAEARLMAL